jgi:hypothetical protein
MERSTLCKDANQEQQRYLNPSHQNPTKATNPREELERKKKMTQRSRSQEFPSLRGIDSWRL